MSVDLNTFSPQQVKGIFKQVGRTGVFDVEDFEEKKWELSTQEHAGDETTQLFHKQGLENTKKAIAGAFVDAQVERDSATVARTAEPENALQQVLSILKRGPSASSSAVPAGDEPPAQSEQKAGPPQGPGDMSDEDSDDDGLSFARRLADASGKKPVPKQAAKAKASAKAQLRASGSTPTVAPATAKQPVSVPVKVAESNPVVPAETGEPQESDPPSKRTFLLDGRGNRTKETLNKHLKDFVSRRAHLSLTMPIHGCFCVLALPK